MYFFDSFCSDPIFKLENKSGDTSEIQNNNNNNDKKTVKSRASTYAHIVSIVSIAIVNGKNRRQ